MSSQRMEFPAVTSHALVRQLFFLLRDETSHCKSERSDSAKKPRIGGQTLNPRNVAVAR
jgi:hypothetical protein